MFLVSLAEGFIHLFQAAGKIFLDMMTGLIPMLICLLLAILRFIPARHRYGKACYRNAARSRTLFRISC